jgi:hypothetical protein
MERSVRPSGLSSALTGQYCRHGPGVVVELRTEAERVQAPGVQAGEIERHAGLPAGGGERFTGYGVIGLPFASGHVLAMRRFPASSIGPAYTSVWHRDPSGRWEFWQDQADDQACSRYFGPALAGTRRVHIELDWTSESTLQIAIAEASFTWQMILRASAATRALSAVGTLLPDRAWRSSSMLALMGPAAGKVLRAGRVAMTGNAPDGHAFVLNPQQVWLIAQSSACLGDEHFGLPGPLGQQVRLGDFWIPQRGVFAIGRAFFGDS